MQKLAPLACAEEACRRQVALGHLMPNPNNPNEAVQRQLEEMRCDEIGREERAVAREDARRKGGQDAHEEAVRAHNEAEHNASAARRRASPKVPELGATVPEIQAICARQGARASQAEEVITCSLGAPLFQCKLDASAAASRCDGYYEGGDLADARRVIEEKLGAPTFEGRTDDGYRLFVWRGPTMSLGVTMYASGVRMTNVRNDPAAAAQASAP